MSNPIFYRKRIVIPVPDKYQDKIKKILLIAKHNGYFRVIYIPRNEFKKELRYFLLSDPFFKNFTFPLYVQGFLPARGSVSNAIAHLNRNYTLMLDLKDFFDSINQKSFSSAIPPAIWNYCGVENQNPDYGIDLIIPQGFPTSPMLSNIAALELDKAINNACNKLTTRLGDLIIYTRYADDLILSFDKLETYLKLKEWVISAIHMAGFKINPQKTRLQYAKGGRRIITGIAVDNQIHVPRYIKRRIRALKYKIQNWNLLDPPATPTLQQLESRLKGFESYQKLVNPQTYPLEYTYPPQKQFSQAVQILKGLKKEKILPYFLPANKLIPEVTEKRIVDGKEYVFAITNDPVYIIGMSTFTTGWSSCMELRHGGFSNGVWFWQYHPGVSCAVILSTKVMALCGVKRPCMYARTLLYKLDSGAITYGRVYPGNAMARELHKWLEGRGISFVNRHPLHTHIKGHVPEFTYKIKQEGFFGQTVRLPYFDNTHEDIVHLKGKTGDYYRLQIGVEEEQDYEDDEGDIQTDTMWTHGKLY